MRTALLECCYLVAEVAIWLIDHQMNRKLGDQFGKYYLRLTRTKAVNIIFGNALQIEWIILIKPRIVETYFYDKGRKEVAGKIEEVNYAYILGNPPFISKSSQNEDQKKDLDLTFKGVSGTGVLDYVAAWYLKAAKYIQNSKIKVAFVSTNSISQGEQVGILWNDSTEVASLADLYDPIGMPPKLSKAQQLLGKAVDNAYHSQPFTTEAKRMEFLFELYEKYTADLFTIEKPKKKRKESIFSG
jgi:hypothetical protein